MTELRRTRRPLNAKDYLLYSNDIKIYFTEDNSFKNDQPLLKGNDPKEKNHIIDVAQKELRNYYSNLLKNTAYKNIIVLSGAGISKEGAKKRQKV